MKKQKIAITGTTSGIGAGLATALKNDYELVLIDRNEISNRDKIDLTGVDILINNAGHSLGGGIGLIAHNPNWWNDIIDINLTVPIFLTQKFINQNAKGKIIFITSKIVEKNLGGDSVYAASKSGLSTFIQCMRDELKATEFKLVEIRPGRVKTNFAKNRKIHSDIDKFYNSNTHMTVDEVLEIILFSIRSQNVEQITISKS